MLSIHPHYVTDTKGNKISVLLTFKEFQTIIDELEELDDIRLYDEAKESDEPSIGIDDAFAMIEAKRN